MINKRTQQVTDKRVRQIVTRAITEALLEPERYYHPCGWKGKLQRLHVHHTKEHHPSFYAANGYVFMEGLSIHQWQFVTNRVMDSCRRCGITPRSRLATSSEDASGWMRCCISRRQPGTFI